MEIFLFAFLRLLVALSRIKFTEEHSVLSFFEEETQKIGHYCHLFSEKQPFLSVFPSQPKWGGKRLGNGWEKKEGGKMHPKGYKRTITKRHLSKCGICRTFNQLMYDYSDLLEKNEEIESFETNYLIIVNGEEYTSDFVARKTDGGIRVRECCSRHGLKSSAVALLDLSRNYWLSQGVSDWGIVTNNEKE